MASRQVVRYYDQEYDPQLFATKGWRGRFVLLLSRLIWWLEARREYHVMLAVAKQNNASKEQVGDLKKLFKLDQRKHEPLQATMVGTLIDDDGATRSRYENGRKNSDDEKPGYRARRAAHARDLFTQYATGVGRAGRFRYARGQRLANPEGDFTSVADEE